jgi:serine/threonine-protein kinase
MDHILAIPMGKNTLAMERKNLDRVLPVDASRTPRRAAFNAQLRAESAGALGMMDVCLESLRFADGNSLIDIVWLDNCPLFDPMRNDPEFAKLRERVAVRAKRVADMLDVRSPTLG